MFSILALIASVLGANDIYMSRTFTSTVVLKGPAPEPDPKPDPGPDPDPTPSVDTTCTATCTQTGRTDIRQSQSYTSCVAVCAKSVTFQSCSFTGVDGDTLQASASSVEVLSIQSTDFTRCANSGGYVVDAKTTNSTSIQYCSFTDCGSYTDCVLDLYCSDTIHGITIQDTQFTNCKSYGGTVHIAASGSVSLQRCTFTDCQANHAPACMDSSASSRTVTIQSTKFLGSTILKEKPTTGIDASVEGATVSFVLQSVQTSQAAGASVVYEGAAYTTGVSHVDYTPADTGDDEWNDGESESDGRNHIYWSQSSSATDASGCTQSAPCKSLASVLVACAAKGTPLTIHLSSGTFTTTSLGTTTEDWDYVITGQGYQKTTWTLPSSETLFTVDYGATIKVQKGFLQSPGGSVSIVRAGHLILVSDKFSCKSGKSLIEDGMIVCYNAQLTIKDCIFDSISFTPSKGDGDVIHAAALEYFSLQDDPESHANVNASKKKGNAKPSLSISGTSFSGCSTDSTYSAGAVVIAVTQDTDLSFTNVRFATNNAGAYSKSVAVVTNDKSLLSDSSIWSGLVSEGGSTNAEFKGFYGTSLESVDSFEEQELSGPRSEGGSGDDDSSITTIIIVIVVVVVVVILIAIAVIVLLYCLVCKNKKDSQYAQEEK